MGRTLGPFGASIRGALPDNGQSMVFVLHKRSYEKRVVSTGIVSDDRIEIREGLNPGDQVVIKGNYLLLEQSKGGR
jgi:multidrug efflux pump subunit AcrA (membrane-fusion protein)